MRFGRAQSSENWVSTSDPRFLKAVVSLAFLPLGVLAFITPEIGNLQKFRPWKDAVMTDAVVVSHEVKRFEDPDFHVPLGDDYVRYSYDVSGKAFYGEITTRHTSDTWIHYKNQRFKPLAGVRLPLYFQPAAPQEHVLYDDPRPYYKQSVLNLSIAAGICVSVLLLIASVAVFYRPKSRGPNRLPDRLDLSAPDEVG